MTAPILGVGAIVTRADELLMVRRANDPGRGLWSVPGGRVEMGEYLVDALRREVKEETGLDVEVGALLGIFEVVGDDAHYVIHDYLAAVVGADEPAPAGDVSEARWVGLSEIGDMECTPRFVETMQAWGVVPTSSGGPRD